MSFLEKMAILLEFHFRWESYMRHGNTTAGIYHKYEGIELAELSFIFKIMAHI